MYDNHGETIFGYLGQGSLVSAERLAVIRARASSRRVSLADALIDEAAMTRSELLESLAAHLGYDYIADLPAMLPEALVKALPGQLARRFGAVPCRLEQERIDLAVSDPFVVESLDELEFLLGRPVRFVLADPDRVSALIQVHYAENSTLR